jgi:hypothetical protein
MNTDQIPEESQRTDSVMDLVRGIFQDFRTLSVKEFTAAKLEIGQEITKAAKSSILLAIGVFILAIGVVLLSIVLALLLARYTALPLWASFGIVGALYSGVGAVIILVGKNKMEKTKPIPELTLRSTKEDARYIRQSIGGH